MNWSCDPVHHICWRVNVKKAFHWHFSDTPRYGSVWNQYLFFLPYLRGFYKWFPSQIFLLQYSGWHNSRVMDLQLRWGIRNVNYLIRPINNQIIFKFWIFTVLKVAKCCKIHFCLLFSIIILNIIDNQIYIKWQLKLMLQAAHHHFSWLLRIIKEY